MWRVFAAFHAKTGLSALHTGSRGYPPSTPNYFFTPRTASFAALATRNLTTVLAGILIFCCVFGLKPVRAFLFCFNSLPNPGKTNSPFFLISLYARLLSVSRNTPAIFFIGLGCFGKSELKFCFGHLLSVMAAAANDFKERRVADRVPRELTPHCEKQEDFGHHLRRAAKRPLFYDDSLISARLSKRVNCFRNVNGTSPVGPLRCLGMISSATPLSSCFASSSFS